MYTLLKDKNMKPKKATKNKLVSQGVLSSDSALHSYHTLDELLGEKVHNPFGVNTLEDFEDSLASMGLQEMAELGTKVEIMPIHDRRIMKDRLLKKFKETSSKNNFRGRKVSPSSFKLSKAKQKIQDSILSEGK